MVRLFLIGNNFCEQKLSTRRAAIVARGRMKCAPRGMRKASLVNNQPSSTRRAAIVAQKLSTYKLPQSFFNFGVISFRGYVLIMGIEDFQSLYLRSILPLFAVAISKGVIFYYVLWRPKYQSPGTRKEQSSRSLFTSCLLGQHSSVERALSLKPIVCFLGAVELTQLAALCASN